RLPGAALTGEHLVKALIIALLCQVCLYYAELYDFRVLRDRRELVVRLLQALGSTSLILAGVYFWFPSLIIGRGVFVIATILVISGAVGWRLAFEWFTGRVGPRERLLLVGVSAATVNLAKEIEARTDLGVAIVGFVDPGVAGHAAVAWPASVTVLGSLEDIP